MNTLGIPVGFDHSWWTNSRHDFRRRFTYLTLRRDLPYSCTMLRPGRKGVGALSRFNYVRGTSFVHGMRDPARQLVPSLPSAIVTQHYP